MQALRTIGGLGHWRHLSALAACRALGQQIAPRGWGLLCAAPGMPVLHPAQQRDQGRINFRKLNGKGDNTNIKKTNPSSWVPATALIVIFTNFSSCLISSDNYQSQAIDTSLMVSSWAGITSLGLPEMHSSLSRLRCSACLEHTPKPLQTWRISLWNAALCCVNQMPYSSPDAPPDEQRCSEVSHFSLMSGMF